MAIVRRFLIAPAFARLVRKERGAVRVTEGYFPNQSGRQSHVLVEGSQCHLVLVTPNAGGAATEERTEVPRGHADALLDVCAGKAIYDRSRVAIGGGRDAFIDHVVTPGALDLVTLEFEEEAEANRFQPAPWFGPDVSARDGYDNRAIALQGLPSPTEVAISNAALEGLLDTLENRGMSRFALPPRPSAGEGGEVLDTLRRMAASKPENEGLPPAATLPQAPQPAASAPAAPEPAPATENDSRIDDVIASLSQALGAADGAPEEPRQGEAVEVERWTSRLRRSQG
jgi:CYTH domain-containing protein